MNNLYTVAILTVSDKGARGERLDKSGQVIHDILIDNGYVIKNRDIVADEIDEIKKKLIDFSDEDINLIVTTGGTGFSKRDVTPEATLQVIEKRTPGIPEAMRAESLKITPRAILTREEAGIRKNSLIINLPGSPKAVKENLEAVIASIGHGLDILLDRSHECAKE